MTDSIRHALLADLPHQDRALVRLTGEDATRFLQGLLTADVGELTPGQATPAALLTIKGKIVSEIWVLAIDEDEPWLAVPAELGDVVAKQLDDHIIMDDVELERLDHACMAVWAEGQASAPDLGPIPEGLRVFRAKHPLPGLLVVGPAAALAELAGSGQVGSAADVEAFTAARIETRRPAWGHELRADRFPPEVGFVDAVSYDKGCYMGQEPLSRIHNRGQVNRVMVAVEFEGAIASAGPVDLRAADSDKVLGELTSWVQAGRGLAIVRRAQAKSGTELRTAPDGVALKVVTGPLGDDPGGPGRAKTATVSLGGRR